MNLTRGLIYIIIINKKNDDLTYEKLRRWE